VGRRAGRGRAPRRRGRGRRRRPRAPAAAAGGAGRRPRRCPGRAARATRVVVGRGRHLGAARRRGRRHRARGARRDDAPATVRGPPSRRRDRAGGDGVAHPGRWQRHRVPALGVDRRRRAAGAARGRRRGRDGDRGARDGPAADRTRRPADAPGNGAAGGRRQVLRRRPHATRRPAPPGGVDVLVGPDRGRARGG
jgi:hypothetical protein